MPSAIETLVKILKLEKQQGASNKAVVGGLGAFSANWALQAYEQARKPEQRRLVDELASLMRGYDGIENKAERLNMVNYMLDRVTGRAQPPSEHTAFDDTQLTSLPPKAMQPVPPAPRDAPPARPPRRDQDRIRERRQQQENAGQQPDNAAEQAPAADAPTEQPQRPPRRDQDRPPRENRGEPRQRDARLAQQEQDTRQARESRQNQTERRDNRPAAQNERRDNRPPQGRDNRPGSNQQQQRGGRPGGRPDPRRHSHGGDDGDHMQDSADVNFDTTDPIEATHTGTLDIPAEVRLARPPRSPRPVLDPELAADTMRGLMASVSEMRGVGPKMVETLAKLNIHTIQDLLYFLPRRYDDYTKLTPLARLQPYQDTTVIATVRRAELRVTKGGRKDLWVEFDDGTATLGVTFFGQHYLSRTFQPGAQFVLHGHVGAYQGRPQLSNPEWEQIDPENLRQVGIVPVYPLTEGVTAKTMRRMMRETVSYWAERLPDYMPEAVLERAELADIGWAIRNLHFPEGHDHLQHAQNRWVFDQLLMLQMAILATRREWQSVPGTPLPVEDGLLDDFTTAVFPYPLTGAQKRAIDDIRRDVAKSVPMNRLLQGDVGAGKTAVALSAMAMAFANGKQAVLMAPTSILAEQHYRGLTRQLPNTPGDRKPVVALLTSAISAADRREVLAGLANGSIDMVVGTHAVIEDKVDFANLALVVIDEQHRFGVQQRGLLRGKGTNPHVLVMTATPIPRTLALTLFADLDLSVLDEMPPGRTPIATRIVFPVERERMNRFVEEQLQKGRQAFVVHPLVEAGENPEIASAVEAFERLSKTFHRHRVGLLHGRMRAAEKDNVMGEFSRGEIDVLVTTSVAEVGVDVPNASVIIIEGANRFGLAQLHQFRGRVGRGQHQSYCFLVPDLLTPESEKRLKVLVETNDGFKLAEEDWKQRGAGDLVGTRQSGRNKLQLLEAMMPTLVETAQREARTLFAEDPTLTLPEHRLLAQRVTMMHPESDVS
jgi:ATP-dependent DNA helicase RecG